ncbi:crossover junction endodeoxyribonuclease RuvC [Micromonospora robiginosa]|uniref:Crossover junction endodeoxyribonuclease RuvC n=1 Tax=Micromonospora robiginosa TaxID=2749844 RepID=A0A7L6B7K9_9ACTN|nr:crossover junction endodeoxyribonuclease RuvC [Micromonospora ferruginea]QLQ37962.1 crossover junction endodeoxyribonuclease RuvC [Micromonospora ferruginea]
MSALRMVALDLSLAGTGIAATHDHHGQAGLLARTVLTARTAHGTTDMDHTRVNRVLADVAAAVACRPHLVVVEWLPMYDGKGATTLRLAELHGVMKHWLHVKGIRYVDVHPPEVKTWATGKGNANKTQVLEAITATYGRLVHVEDHNAADAVSLLTMALAAYGQQLVALPHRHHHRALENVRWPALATEHGPVVPGA